MNGFEKRAAMIKEKIMAASLELMRTTEPKRIRIADLAKAAGVSQVSIYNHFGSKEALFREVFKAYLNKFNRQYETLLQEKLPMREMVERIFAMEKESFEYFPPHLMKELLIDDPELARSVEQEYTELTLPATVGMLQEWKDRGEISKSIEVEHVLAFMQLFKQQRELILTMAEQSGDMEKFLDGMAHLFFYGVSGKP
jgi:AcrR family transcriptional regulator